jgi:hypothetical protein
VYVLAIAHGTILYQEQYFSYAAPITDDRNGFYQWTPTATRPQRIASECVGSQPVSARYMIWDDPETQSLTLCDRQTGTVTKAWATSCIRPDLAANEVYVACLDYAHRLAVVIQVHTGARTILGDTVDDANGAIVNGHVYWIVRKGLTEFGNMLNSWALPAA